MEKIMPSKCQWMATNRIETRLPFKGLFPVDTKMIESLAEHMQTNGFDQSQPIILWKEKLNEDKNQGVVIDGHTRLLAAKKIGLSPVYVARVSFPDEDAALRYAIHNQRDRRNITDADLLRCIERVDKRKPQGQRTDLASSDAKLGKSSEETAKIVGTSPRKVEKARAVLDHADDQTKQAVLDGKKSIHAAVKETQAKKQKRPKSEKLTKTLQAVETLTNKMIQLHTELLRIKGPLRRYTNFIPLSASADRKTKILGNFLQHAGLFRELLGEILEPQIVEAAFSAEPIESHEGPE